MSPKEESLDLECLIRQSTCYAGVGSRATPTHVLPLIHQIAALLAVRGITLRSGGAPGADTAFESGCDRRNGKKEIFLPWEGFNRNGSPLFSPPSAAENIASQLHPKWGAVKPRFRAFHSRNVQQVLGEHLDVPVDFVIFWAEETYGRVKGGTATAVMLARQRNIPTFNLQDDSTRNAWEQVINARHQHQNLWSRLFQRL